MALTGLQINKLLPATNCKECGSNTCLAFAMKLAAKKAELSACPYASEEAKRVLGAASEPPVKCIELGPEKKLKIGGETCLYRHEKTFFNQTILAVNVDDNAAPEAQQAVLDSVKGYVVERVGEQLHLDMLAVTHKASGTASFVALAKKAWQELKIPLILRSSDPKALTLAAEAVQGSHSVLCAATKDTAEELRAVCEKYGQALTVTAPDLNELVAVTAKLKEAGFSNLLLQFQTHSLAEEFQINSLARRAALKNSCRALGYPSVKFCDSRDLVEICLTAVTEFSKYGGIYVLPHFDPAELVALMTLRQNIYTDPQKPIQVEPKLYAVGEPTPESPVFVTTNFSLTYFIVAGEIENCGLSAWLLVPECEGMSVLTAWAAGKFSGATIAKYAKEIGLDEQVTARRLIIPGYVAQISGELEEGLPGWKVIVGPEEASDLESFVQARLR